MNDWVFSLTAFDEGGGPALYAGGSFSTAGGISANHIAKWDGSTWSALGTGTGGTVYALTVFDDGGGPALYAGGGSGVTKWNGSTWSVLGTGMNSAVRALSAFDDGGESALYAGGEFTTAGGVNAKFIAQWNGASWSAVGSGMNNTVRALAVHGDNGGASLYAGGDFLSAGGVSASRIARWDGSGWSRWSTLGTGTNGPIFALTVFDDGSGPVLHAGGGFTTAGGVVSAYLAKWACGPCNPVDCTSQGVCVVGMCLCDTGYAGAACDQCATDYSNYPTCTFCQAATTCSGNGTCNALGGCDCNTSFVGAACDQCATDYYNYPTCTFCQAATTCSGNGTCNGLGGCDCNVGFVGVTCDQCGPNYYNYPTCTFCLAAATCNNNGTCNGLGGCNCNTGFVGAACDACAPNYYNYPTCTFCLAASTCSGNGTCNGVGGCNCDPCWTGANCEIGAITPSAAPAPFDRLKNRYISFTPNNCANSVAFRVVKTTLPTGFCWVQTPVAAGNDINTAKCAATPVFRVWTEPVVHVGDCAIIPVADYTIFANAPGPIENPVGLLVPTILLPSLNFKLWGDNVGSNNGSEWTPPNQFTNVNDVLSLLAFIGNATIRPQFTVANLQAISSADSCLNAFVNTSDVLIVVQAIAGASYGPPSSGKITDPANCPVCP